MMSETPKIFTGQEVPVDPPKRPRLWIVIESQGKSYWMLGNKVIVTGYTDIEDAKTRALESTYHAHIIYVPEGN